MITIRKSADRGQAMHGWLDSRHTFSFADYRDARHMGFGPLRVINEDRVEPGKGFAAHSHRDMEIVSYVLDGALEHRDSMGNGSVIRPGDVQTMRAGTGVTHSEYNHSRQDWVHFLQIWIVPDTPGLPPAYGQKHFPEDERRGRLRLVASRDGRDGSLEIHQDASIYASILDAGSSVTHELAAGRRAWVQMIRGRAEVGIRVLDGGDGAAIEDETSIAIRAEQGSELLLFDLP
jgi:redox-sensitive bicupin YhaK (pirin superfamily)